MAVAMLASSNERTELFGQAKVGGMSTSLAACVAEIDAWPLARDEEEVTTCSMSTIAMSCNRVVKARSDAMIGN
jgi:hypothetical protein